MPDVKGLVQVVQVEAGKERLATQGPELEEEAEERPEEQQQAEPWPGGSSAMTPLEAVEALQVRLSSESARARRAYIRVKRKTAQSRKPILERRRAMIQCIPGFWAKAVSLLRLLVEDC